jgi:hypothetical protein
MGSVYDLCQPKHPYVKLAHRRIAPELASNQKRIDDVLLHDPLVALVALQELHQLLNITEYSDASSSVAILSWFTNPGDSFQLFDMGKLWRGCHVGCGFKVVGFWQVLELFIFVFQVELAHRD